MDAQWLHGRKDYVSGRRKSLRDDEVPDTDMGRHEQPEDDEDVSWLFEASLRQAMS